MRNAELPELAIRTFCHHLAEVGGGARGLLGRDSIAPADHVIDADTLDDHAASGRDALSRALVIKLNGGLGTSMGLDRAKSLIEVRDGLSFLDLIARQIGALRRSTGARVPLVLMNSFRTERDTLAALGHRDLRVQGLPLSFVQHRVPKIVADTLQPVVHSPTPTLEWCPPGHGDLYTALVTSGALDAFLERGLVYAFVSNADNLGATLDPALLGHMADLEIPFLMEVADRTSADRKGGHLCRLHDGRLALREAAQCPAEEREEFQDINRYRFFNTNNLWLHLPSLERLLSEHDGVLPLNTIVNHKTVDPRDPTSTPVLQLETAMGSALSLFDGAVAVRVPRRRFSPVKTTNDLLGVRSDAFELTDDGHIVLSARRAVPPTILLDPEFFRLVDDFQARFPHGPPSLRECESLTVDGDVTFAEGVVVRGGAHVRAEAPARIDPGTVVTGDVLL